MPTVTCDMAVSVDGYIAGPNQTLERPMGDGVGDHLHRWMFEDAEANAPEIEVENTTLEPLGARTTKYVTHLTYRILRH